MTHSRGGPADVLYVLLLVQAAAGLLASFGELLFMQNALYLVLPVLRAALLVLIAAKIVRGRRWAMVAALVMESFALFGMWAGALLGLAPGLSPSFTLAGLVTGVALPIAVIVLAARLLATRADRALSHGPRDVRVPAAGPRDVQVPAGGRRHAQTLPYGPWNTQAPPYGPWDNQALPYGPRDTPVPSGGAAGPPWVGVQR